MITDTIIITIITKIYAVWITQVVTISFIVRWVRYRQITLREQLADQQSRSKCPFQLIKSEINRKSQSVKTFSDYCEHPEADAALTACSTGNKQFFEHISVLNILASDCSVF